MLIRSSRLVIASCMIGHVPGSVQWAVGKVVHPLAPWEKALGLDNIAAGVRVPRRFVERVLASAEPLVRFTCHVRVIPGGNHKSSAVVMCRNDRRHESQ